MPIVPKAPLTGINQFELASQIGDGLCSEYGVSGIYFILLYWIWAMLFLAMTESQPCSHSVQQHNLECDIT